MNDATPDTKSRQGWWTTRSLLVCYAPIGDPECPPDLLEVYAKGGVDIVEAGVPSVNPHMDGPTVADSMRRAATRGMKFIPGVIERHADALRGRCHVVLMGYADMPYSDYTQLARRGIIDGLMMVEGSGVNEPAGLSGWLEANGVQRTGFVDADLSAGSVERARHSGGYVMLQACSGPTGVREVLDPGNAAKIVALRRAGVGLPIVLGFGIGTLEQAADAIALGADGVVVGSACIEAARRGGQVLVDFIASLRSAVDAATARRAAANGG